MKNANNRVIGVVFALIVTFVTFSILEPVFYQIDNLLEIGVQAAIITFVALGVTFVIVTGGIDISVGSMVGLVSVICATNLPHWGIAKTIVAAILIGSFLGFFNGAISAYFQLQSFVVTLATLNLFRGIAFVYTQGRPIYNLDTKFREVFSAELGPIPKPILLITIMTISSFLLLNRTKVGVHIKAVGTNLDAARKSGISVKRAQISAFVICGAFCGLASLMLMSRIGAAEPISGTGFELQAIAAVVVGGTSLMGGRGSIVGTVLGSLLLASISVGLTLLNINAFVQLVVTGLIVLVAVLIDRFATTTKSGR